uniref:Nicotinic acetylcholine receptor alpha subunit n=1 Tax=Ditylenchus dipsaci TaxID=166011 RepID=A0A915DNN7_9BILA
MKTPKDCTMTLWSITTGTETSGQPARTAESPASVKVVPIIDVHELDQIMTCSVWLKQIWLDRKLAWHPESYGGVSVLYVPYEMIWVPDIVLFNNADSNYNITISTKATLHYSGKVTWEPPAIFKSLSLQFEVWLLDLPRNLLTLELLGTEEEPTTEEITNERGELENVRVVEDGIGTRMHPFQKEYELLKPENDLSDYYPSVEWDIMSRIAKRRARNYPSGCCPKTGVYVEVNYFLVLRRKPLFYTVNLVFPCVGISFLTVLVFYLPSDSGEKVSLSINILVALTMFFLLLIEIIPANSISLPFVGKYLLFTMILVTLSVLITVVSLQFHWRKPTTHTMSNWIKTMFLDFLPRVLWMRRPQEARSSYEQNERAEKIFFNYHEHRVSIAQNAPKTGPNHHKTPQEERLHKIYNSPKVQKSFQNLCFIAELLKKKDRDNKVDQDWKYVAMVLDRLFLMIISMVCFFGAGFILMQAPTFYDTREPIDLQYRPEDLNIKMRV